MPSVFAQKGNVDWRVGAVSQARIWKAANKTVRRVLTLLSFGAKPMSYPLSHCQSKWNDELECGAFSPMHPQGKSVAKSFPERYAVKIRKLSCLSQFSRNTMAPDWSCKAPLHGYIYYYKQTCPSFFNISWGIPQLSSTWHFKITLQFMILAHRSLWKMVKSFATSTSGNEWQPWAQLFAISELNKMEKAFLVACIISCHLYTTFGADRKETNSAFLNWQCSVKSLFSFLWFFSVCSGCNLKR